MESSSQKKFSNETICPFFPEVWAIQRKIYSYPFAVKLDEMARHPAIIGYSKKLASHYFRQSQKKSPTAFDLITKTYLLAILLYPLQERILQRVYKPCWSSQVLCSWMRKAVTQHTKQYFFLKQIISEEWKDETILYQTLKQTDKSWLTFAVDFLLFQSNKSTLSGKLSKMIIDQFLYTKFDEILNAEFGISCSTQLRKMRRKKGLKTASAIRIGNTTYLFGDINCSKDGIWNDLRIGQENIYFFVINYQTNKYGEGLNIQINSELITSLKNEIKLIISSKYETVYKYLLICKKISYFSNIICCATGSRNQLFELDRWISDKIQKHIFSNLSDEKRKSLFHLRTNLKSVLTSNLVNNCNLFNYHKINLDNHVSMFSPYR